MSGKISALHDYGAFVDIGGFQALLPVSEISYERVQNIEDVLHVGQEITVQVIKADWKAERVSLSLKALQENPWNKAGAKYNEGTKVDGTISRVADFGVFVNLEPGIDGLVHVSELNQKPGTNLRKVFKAGEKMSVVVKSFDSQERRISLALASSREQDLETTKYLSGDANSGDGETYNPFAALLKK